MTKLSDLQKKINLVQSIVQIGFWEFDIKRNIFKFSHEAACILGIENDLIINLTAFIENYVAIPDQKKVLTDFTLLFEHKKNLDLVFIIKNLKIEPGKVLRAMADIPQCDGKDCSNILGIIHDISIFKETERKIKEAKEKAEETDMLKSVFLSNMSHEIRTPLNAILGFSRLLSNADISDIQRNEYGRFISSSTNNLLNLIRDITDVSKIEAGELIIEPQNCLINNILDELKSTFEKEKESQNKNHIQLSLKKAIHDNDFSVITDPFRFQQILINLIGNALKFIEKGYIEFGYTIRNKDFLQFYVKDTGIGIPENKKDLIFSRFGQIINNKIKNPGGTGLGLSITQHLVEKLGGKIWFESSLDIGTSFLFTLPYIKGEGDDNQYVRLDEEIISSIHNRINLLVVEDDPLSLVLLVDTLNYYASNVLIDKANNGEEAINLIRNNNYDLIIMDIRMPKMDGYETTQYIRNELSEPKNQIPILGLSAHALKDEIDKGKSIGMNDFLTKPVEPGLLLSKIYNLCSRENKEKTLSNNTIILDKIAGTSFDLSFLEQLFKGDVQKIRKILITYLKEVPDQIQNLSVCFKQSDWNKLSGIAHSLKSSFKYIGRADLSELSKEIESQAKRKINFEKIKLQINSILKEWQIIEKDLKNRI